MKLLSLGLVTLCHYRLRGGAWMAIVCALLLSGCTTHRAAAPQAPAAIPPGPGATALVGVLATPAVQAALSYIEREQARGLRELVELTQIPAPPFGETARAKRFAQMLSDTGFGPVSTDAAGNVVARRAGRRGARTIAVVAHLDTVFPADTDVTVRVEGNRYTAPGVGDNTRGLVLVLELARAIVAADLGTDADILLIGDVGEEGLGDLRGVRHLFRDGAPRIDALIAIDGGDVRRIIYGAVGSERFRVTFSGPGGHSWGAYGLANPHHALGAAIERFVARALPITAEQPKSSFNVGRIGGGTSVNSIPFESWMEVDMRSGDPARLALLVAAFKLAMGEAQDAENDNRRRGAPLQMTVDNIGSRPAGTGDQAAPLVVDAMAAMRHKGLEPMLSISSTDANIPISLGIPAITLSRGGVSKRAHSLDEYWEDRNTHVATQIALLTLLAQSGVHGD